MPPNPAEDTSRSSEHPDPGIAGGQHINNDISARRAEHIRTKEKGPQREFRSIERSEAGELDANVGGERLTHDPDM